MASTPDTRIKIAIIGGGIAGLALAAAVTSKHPRIDIHVYESVPKYLDVGAGLALHKNAIGALTLLGPQIRQAYFDTASLMSEEEDQEMSTEVVLAYGPNKGECVAELGKAKGRKTVGRAELLEALLKLVPKENISFGKRVAKMQDDEEGVDVEFTDGTKIRVDGLIGADGIHSLTRKHILGADHPAAEPKNYDGWQNYRTMVSTSFAREHIPEKWTRVVPILIGPLGQINCIPQQKGTRISCGVAVRRGSPEAMKSGAEDVLRPEDYQEYSDDAQDIVKMVSLDTSSSWRYYDHDPAPTFYRQRVAMMGDAAHACLPFNGQGAAQALEDAAVLEAVLGEVKDAKALEAAWRGYDSARRERSQAVTEISRRFGRIFSFTDEEVGQDPKKMKEFFAKAGAFSNNADLRSQNEAAVTRFRHVEQNGLMSS